MSLPIIIPVGTRFGKLVVDGEPHRLRNGSGRPDLFYPCVCDCGNRKDLKARMLRGRFATSCGCNLRKGKDGPIGYTKQRSEYHSWRSMKSRCRNENDPAYPRYGGRGVNVCDEWFDSFDKFLADMGPKPTTKYTVDRFPDNNGNYEPGNVRWATPDQQNQNRRDTHQLTLNGVTKSISEWAEVKGWTRGLIYQRIKNGASDEEALTRPIRNFKHGNTKLGTSVSLPVPTEVDGW